MTISTQSKPRFKTFMIGALVAGLIAATVNNIYSFAYTIITGFNVPEVINFGSVTISSIIPAILGALFYFALTKVTSRATIIFVVVSVILIIISFAGPFQPELPDGTPTPDGFAALTLPMHIIAGLVIIWVLTRYVQGRQIV